MSDEGATAPAALELRRQRIRNQAAGSRPAEAAARIVTGIRSFDLVVLLSAAILDHPESDRAIIDWAAARTLADRLPGAQRAAVELAVSLTHGLPIIAVNELADLDDDDLEVVLRAIGHAQEVVAPGQPLAPPQLHPGAANATCTPYGGPARSRGEATRQRTADSGQRTADSGQRFSNLRVHQMLLI